MGNAKKEFLNNIIIQMSDCVDRDILQILEQSITAELVKVTMDSIPTLPALIDVNILTLRSHRFIA